MHAHACRPQLRVEQLEDRAVPAVYYVDPTGSDASAGGSSNNPWQTLQYAANRVVAGDTVIVRAGDYVGFDLRTDGTESNRITFSAEPGVQITTRNPRTPDGINLEGADYVTIEGFTVVGMPRAGIRSVINHHVTIRDNNCDLNEKWGILTGFSDDLLIEDNICTRSKVEHGIYVSNSGDRPVVRGNTMWGNNANGLHMNGDIFSGGDGIISDALVENNVIYENGAGGGSGINCDGVQDSIIRNNLIYNTHASGISLYRIDGGGASTGNLVVNNTVLVASDGRWALNIQNGSINNTVRNNIFHSAHSFRGAIDVSSDSLPGFVSNHNIMENRFTTNGGNSVLTMAQWRTLTGQDTNSNTTSNPNTLFVDATNGDYHLAPGSAAIDMGTMTNAPPTDAEGTSRPSGAGVDIGHDEVAVAGPELTGVLVNGTTAPSTSVTTSRVTSLVLTFDVAVTADAGAFSLMDGSNTLTNDGGGITVTGGGTTTLTLTFTGTSGVDHSSLADGIWTLMTDMSKVRAVGNNQYGSGTETTQHIRRLYGDADGNGVVDLTDFGFFGNAFGQSPGDPGWTMLLDFDASGSIDFTDFGQFANRFGSTL